MNLVFDIETIPQQKPFTDVQQEEFDKKFLAYKKRTPEMTTKEEVDAKRMLKGTNPYFGEIVCIGILQDYGNGKKPIEKFILYLEGL